MIRGLNFEADMAIVYVYQSNNRTSKLMKQKITELKGKKEIRKCAWKFQDPSLEFRQKSRWT